MADKRQVLIVEYADFSVTGRKHFMTDRFVLTDEKGTILSQKELVYKGTGS